jgi:hypothetical protein
MTRGKTTMLAPNLALVASLIFALLMVVSGKI